MEMLLVLAALAFVWLIVELSRWNPGRRFRRITYHQNCRYHTGFTLVNDLEGRIHVDSIEQQILEVLDGIPDFEKL